LIWLIGLAGISFFYIRSKENFQREAQAQTELLQLRHYLKNVFDSMPSILVGVNKNGLITHWNHEAERITGKSSSAVEGKLVDSVIPLLQKQMQRINKAIKENTPQKMERISHNDNNEQHFSDIIIYPLAMNAQIGAVIRIDDITERVHIEEMMIQTEKMLSVGGLAAGMAHEINNPLGGIMQGQQNIQRRLQPDMKKNQLIANKYGIDLTQLQHYLEDRDILHFLNEISKAGKRASTIVVNMLQFSRKTTNKKERVNILDVIDLVIKLASMDYDLKKKFDFRSIEIVRDYANQLPLIHCVSSEIQQVLLNVFRNSAQSMHATDKSKTQSRLRVNVYKVDQYLSIDIEDNGCGMDKETSRRIFEPFYTTKEPGIGTGLGMSVSYFIIVETHGGEMFVESEQEKGTKIIIRLPIL
jgi:two-component system, NtrC family, sensor kinase